MSDHLTQQIVDKARTLLTGLPTTGANVFDGRPAQLSAAQLPALILEEGAESSDTATRTWPRLQIRTADLKVILVVKQDEPLAVRRKIRLEIESALGADPRLGGLARDCRYDGMSEPELTYALEKPAEETILLFKIDYGVAENAPDVPQ